MSLNSMASRPYTSEQMFKYVLHSFLGVVILIKVNTNDPKGMLLEVCQPFCLSDMKATTLVRQDIKKQH